ncbi:MAG: gliding motility-associated ABC transporter ATP-binding subunit GldA [Microscillaceae bacterium]|nr:gliding motility-associated ABC transporter ATP-binding subunit GldA [Microscillaceae bacterium]
MSVIVSNLTKSYGRQNAVDDISFEVKSGEILGFLGPNGAGKSTTMKIATGYLSPSKGTIKVQDFDVSMHSMDVRRNIGYLPEHNPLYLDMYVLEYLSFIGELHGMGGRKLRSRIKEMIELCGLEREQKKKIGTLSKGYRQRVGLAQSLIHNPPVLILDEPTTGLDPNQIVEIRKVIQEIGKEKTVIFSTHIMQEVQAICTRAVIINLGKIVADNAVTSLRGDTWIEVEFAQAIDVEILHKIPEIHTLTPITAQKYKILAESGRDIRPEIFKIAAEQNWTLLGLQQQENSLESVFQSLTKKDTP